jgi:hypothetical protein
MSKHQLKSGNLVVSNLASRSFHRLHYHFFSFSFLTSLLFDILGECIRSYSDAEWNREGCHPSIHALMASMLRDPLRRWVVVDMSLNPTVRPLDWAGITKLEDGLWLVSRVSHSALIPHCLSFVSGLLCTASVR